MSFKLRCITLAIAGLPLLALAEDSITCPPTDNRIDNTCIVVPDGNGTFQFEFRAEAQGNNVGISTIWTKIDVNSIPCAPKRIVGWKTGLGGATAICAKKLETGQPYTITAQTGNENANAVSSVLAVRRIGP